MSFYGAVIGHLSFIVGTYIASVAVRSAMMYIWEESAVRSFRLALEKSFDPNTLPHFHTIISINIELSSVDREMSQI